jgi:hypothetical protein
MSFDPINPSATADINEPGAPGSLQNLLYRAIRCRNTLDWRTCNNLAHSLLQQCTGKQDTELSLLLNAVASLTETVLGLRLKMEEALG